MNVRAAKLASPDLSFNQIEVIEGLDALVKITDLCLTHNKISKIEGIEQLVDLEIFSCANNEISSTEEVLSHTHTHTTGQHN